MTLKLTKDLSKRLGFGEKERIRKDDVSLPIPVSDNKEYSEKARTLVFDTSMVAITMDHKASYYTMGIGDELMTILYPKVPGVLESLPSIAPFVTPSHHRDELTFSLWRYSEDDKPIPLSWKVGAYLSGVLIGKV